jgi:hypothetical protein
MHYIEPMNFHVYWAFVCGILNSGELGSEIVQSRLLSNLIQKHPYGETNSRVCDQEALCRLWQPMDVDGSLSYSQEADTASSLESHEPCLQLWLLPNSVKSFV